MGDNVDVKALRARFSSSASPPYTRSQDNNSPISPMPAFTTFSPSTAEKDIFQPTASEPDMMKLQREEVPTDPVVFAQSPPNIKTRTPGHFSGVNKVKHTGEMLEKMMLGRALGSTAPSRVPTSTPLPLRLRSTSDVVPLRKPLAPEGPFPLKPKRPRNVDLQQFMNVTRTVWPQLAHKSSEATQMSALTVNTPSNPLPQTFNPSRQQKQVTSVDIDYGSYDGSYDDIASLGEKESWSNSSSQWTHRDESDMYEHIDEDQVRLNVNADKKVQEQKRENEFRKKFQLQAEEEIHHTARARHDWYGGGKQDLRVHQGDSIEILRVKNNPEGKWLARSLDGKYGYISNTCVDIDYEAVKRKLFQLPRRTEAPTLPPPPPDPPQVLHMESKNSLASSQNYYYDGFHLSTDDFPPPPPPNEIIIDADAEKELRIKFKYEGPVMVLHTVMMDPNGVMKKLGGKDLHASQGDVLDVIQLTDSKKVLCYNRTSGKYGYVSRKQLVPLST
ncbi:FYN-binding protein 1 [Corythoichthys intestinalis]|uniref:FYN-binding protein 1 n=1 Tax=Corythoichthys intestinalis TaxID=161448 RepID=UPI0025A4EDE1|nr:FYN-binding protein 1 [Corythoichthys intestinalis]